MSVQKRWGSVRILIRRTVRCGGVPSINYRYLSLEVLWHFILVDCYYLIRIITAVGYEYEYRHTDIDTIIYYQHDVVLYCTRGAVWGFCFFSVHGVSAVRG